MTNKTAVELRYMQETADYYNLKLEAESLAPVQQNQRII